MTVLPFAMDVWRHLWVPTTRFVSEMNTGFEQSLDINLYGHDILTPFTLHTYTQDIRAELFR